jgi:hypothetical protein
MDFIGRVDTHDGDERLATFGEGMTYTEDVAGHTRDHFFH